MSVEPPSSGPPSSGPPSSGRPAGPPSGPLSGRPPQPPGGPPGPPPGGRSGAGGAGSHGPWWRSVPRIAAVTAVVVVAAVVAVLLTRPGGGSSAKGEVFLQAAGSTGPDPFTESTANQSTAAESSAPAPTSSASVPANALRGVDGGAPGLYSGVRNTPSCDVEKQIRALQADPAKNRAYAAAAGVQPSSVPAHLRSLTPVTLRVDTRVTAHGYRAGRATSFQSVLQAGTAVLVDGRGVPRARCACGNPLTPPVALRTTPRPTGDHWASYRPSNVVVVSPAPVVVEVFVLYDPQHHDWFHRHRGDDSGRRDQRTGPPKDPQPWNNPVPPATASTGPSKPSPASPSAPSSAPSSSSSSSSPSSSSSAPSSGAGSASPSPEPPSTKGPSSQPPSSPSAPSSGPPSPQTSSSGGPSPASSPPAGSGSPQ
ncbi:DUF6777 domain-containing protein [Streptomyces bungoensis]|uniref:DUF6777 domain-containing protein n=1 Tax=Streptomyces bungoensis TaxID=285568 RepID=UPI0034334E8B